MNCLIFQFHIHEAFDLNHCNALEYAYRCNPNTVQQDFGSWFTGSWRVFEIIEKCIFHTKIFVLNDTVSEVVGHKNKSRCVCWNLELANPNFTTEDVAVPRRPRTANSPYIHIMQRID